MEVITLPDLSVGGQVGPNSDDKTRDKTHCEEQKWNLSFVKHDPHGHISCMAKWAVCEVLDEDKQFDFENNKGQVSFALYCFSDSKQRIQISTDTHTLHI